MQSLHLHVNDVPILKGNSFYKCISCLHAKIQNRNTKPPTVGGTPNNSDLATSIPISELQYQPLENGQEFGMDYGFMRGSGFATKDLEGHTITSIDGYRSYLLIICRKSRYIWVFLPKTKQPPLPIVQRFLQEHGNNTTTKHIIRTDEGGELWGSGAFKSVIDASGYLLEPTAADAPFQNGMAERPNRTLGNMVQCLLHGTNLGPEYWSFTLQHAVYLKNHLPHRMIDTTPYQAYSGLRPSAKYLRVFGCPVIVKLPGKHGFKLDLNATSGRFLGYTASDRNVYYRDNVTGKIKITTHCVFDEAGMTLPELDRSPANRALQQQGYSEQPEANYTSLQVDSDPQNIALVKLLTEDATMPSRATDESAGFDVYSTINITIPPHQRKSIPLDISITPPHGMYTQIMPWSSLAYKHTIDTKAGVIDRDYTGNIQVILHNSGQEDFSIKKGDRIAQLIFFHIGHPSLQQTQSLTETKRADHGFGSTGGINIVRELKDYSSTTSTSTPTPEPNNSVPPLPYDIFLSQDPFDSQLPVEIVLKGDDPTLGMIFQFCKYRNRLQLVNMTKRTPGARVHKWRSMLRHSYLLKLDEQEITNIDDLKVAIQQKRKQGQLKVTCCFTTDRSFGIHPHHGIPQLYFDQLNIIAKHLKSINHDKQSTV
jgi:deoxyuridine 5'-triphosphate nucleotidohydrolase